MGIREEGEGRLLFPFTMIIMYMCAAVYANKSTPVYLTIMLLIVFDFSVNFGLLKWLMF